MLGAGIPPVQPSTGPPSELGLFLFAEHQVAGRARLGLASDLGTAGH